MGDASSEGSADVPRGLPPRHTVLLFRRLNGAPIVVAQILVIPGLRIEISGRSAVATCRCLPNSMPLRIRKVVAALCLYGQIVRDLRRYRGARSRLECLACLAISPN